MSRSLRVAVVGFMSPTPTGQAIATDRLVSILGSEFAVSSIALPGGAPGRSRTSRLLDGSIRLRNVLREADVRSHDVAIWTAMSDSPLGHARDLAISSALDLDSTIAWVHRGSVAVSLTRPVLGASMARLMRRLARTVFLEESLIPRRHLGEGVAVIPNVLPADFAASTSERERLQAARTERLRDPTHPLKVLFVGLLMEAKGVRVGLRAIDRLEASGHDAYLDIAGKWASEEERRVLGPVVEAHPRVRRTGALAPNEVRERMDAADVMVLPTRHEFEAQPLVILEAMSRGLPLVTSRRGAIPNIVGAESSGLCDPTVEGVTVALAKLADPRTNSLESERLHMRFRKRYSRTAVFQRWASLIREVAGAP